MRLPFRTTGSVGKKGRGENNGAIIWRKRKGAKSAH